MKPVYSFRVPGLSARFLCTRNMAPLLILVNLCCLLGPSQGQAEGTKGGMPVSGSGTCLIVSTNRSLPLRNEARYLDTPVDQSVFVNIIDYISEELYYS